MGVVVAGVGWGSIVGVAVNTGVGDWGLRVGTSEEGEVVGMRDVGRGVVSGGQLQ